MANERPRIAVPEPTAGDAEYNQRSLPQYLAAIEAAGGTGVVLHLNQSAQELSEVLATCSGILLPGSPADVDPHRYGQEPVEACAARDEAREAADTLMLQHSYEAKKPLFGICFGLQSLNVWKKGSLLQDLPAPHAANPEVVNHQPGREVMEAHKVGITGNSRLYQILLSVPDAGADPLSLSVNSSHHQAIDQPGSGLKVVARCSVDGTIEALETTEPERFVLAVQWHPERSYQHSAASRALFAAFLTEARAWQATSSPLQHA